METPRSLRQRPARNPTPRLSERKKSLFAARNEKPEVNSDSEQENYTLDGIEPLNGNKDSHRSTSKIRPVKVHLRKTPMKALSFLKNSNGSSPERMDDDVFEKLPESPPSPACHRRSLRSSDRSPPTTSTEKKEPTTPPLTKINDKLLNLFTNSMNLNQNKKTIDEEIVEESSDDEGTDKAKAIGKKRIHLESESSSVAKIRRLDTSEDLSIPTKSFYSHNKTSPTVKSPTTSVVAKYSPRMKASHRNPARGKLINKGVSHKIRRKPKHKISSAVTSSKANVIDILSTIRNERLRNLLTAKRLEKDQIENCHRILNYGKNPIEMAKPLTVIGRSNSAAESTNNDDNNNKDKSPGATKMCYESGDVSLGFSDIECSSESEEELVEKAAAPVDQPEEVDEELENRTPNPVPGRKFFKSGHSTLTKKEVKITDNIKASVCNGKLTLQNPKQRKKKIKLRNTQVNAFSSEQARVDEILKNFDISTIAVEELESGKPVVEDTNQNPATCPTPTLSVEDYDAFDEMRMTETEDDDEYHEFRRRLPYNTNDPELIEQQHILLDFLISNNICTEENFITFIADPENHKEEAQKILDQIVVVVTENPDDYRQRIPYNTTDPIEIDQQSNFIEFLIEHNLCNEENFQIFIADYANRHEDADRIITEVVARTHNISHDDLELELSRISKQSGSMDVGIPDQNKQNQKAVEAMVADAGNEKLFPIFYPGRCQPIAQTKSTRKLHKSWDGGYGLDQYQIDAGQRQFGPRQCKQCGLVYTVHEPEEEKLHKEFHSSLYVLKFKSWIDEDIVHIYPEWGPDGRIIRITNNSHVKRQERLKDVLRLVDKELGFSSYILPQNYIAYFAVRQSQIVGLCLVEPLEKAHRYMLQNGVDCCTEETFEAKCGISRIWVSPLHRRFHIASKLVLAVQLYTIFSEEIPLDKIAFSAPTEDGKKFAKSVTKSENFLVYQ